MSNKKEKHALLLGINYTDPRLPEPLNGCVNDARLLKTFIKEELYFEENNITMMLDEDIKNTKSNLYPSKKNIMDQMKILFSKKNSQLFFSYSGHGFQHANSTEKDGKMEVIVPADIGDETSSLSSYITDDEIRELIDNNMSKTSNLYIIMDCCNSGTNFDLPYKYLNKQISNTGEDIGDLPFIIKLSSSTDPQLSRETKFKGVSYGIFTHTFVNTYDFNYTYKEMVDKLDIKIGKILTKLGETEKQTPLSTSSRENNFDDKLFSQIDEKDDKKKEDDNLPLILGLSLGIGIPIIFSMIYIIFFKPTINNLLIISSILIIIGLVMLAVAISESADGNQFYWAAPWIPLIAGFSILSTTKYKM